MGDRAVNETISSSSLLVDPAEPAAIPQYLERPRPGAETFGTLYRRQTRDGGWIWEIHGDPQVVMLAKRLFPGSEAGRHGEARFSTTPRVFADLVWLMQRWPLVIDDPAAWEANYQVACSQVLRRMELNQRPARSLPGAQFRGTLRPFQEEALSWCMNNMRTLLADDMGLGKTPVSLAVLATMGAWPAVIVVQPHMIIHWEEKAREFLTVNEDAGMPLFDSAGGLGLKVHTIRGLKPGPLPEAHIYIIHYLLLRAWREVLKAVQPRMIVFDEVQELRHTGTEKYSAASDLSTQADCCLGLSGTPIYNRGGEIWNVINCLEFHALGDYDSFSREWSCGYGSGKAADTIKEPEVLGAHLRREGLMIRRRKEDVLPDLPPKRRLVQSIEGDHKAFRELVKAAEKLAREAAGIKDIFERGRMEQEAVNQTRQATGMAKAPSVGVFVRGLLEAGEPVLLFAHHHAVVDKLMEDLAEFKPMCITGRQNANEKQASKVAFIEGKTNLLIISLRSATGIDGLQARARVVVFAELDWAPAVHTQAEDRAHRWDVKDSILVYYLVTSFGTDPEMQEALGLKVSQFVGLMGDQVESDMDRELAVAETSSHLKKVLETLRGDAKCA